MSVLIPQTVEGVNRLLDHLMAVGGLKNDAAICVALDVMPPVISKIRNGHMKLGPTLLIYMHEALGESIKDMKAMAAGASSGGAK
jgi:hypothetical protein